MKAIENIADVSPSTFARKRARMFWSKLYAETVKNVQIAKISKGAKLTYFYLQPLFKQSEEPGYLVMNSQPISTKNLASLLGTTQAVLEKELQELFDVGVLSKKTSSGIPTVFDPIMVLDEEASSYEDDRKSEKDDPSQTSSAVEYSKVKESRATERSDYSTTSDDEKPLVPAVSSFVGTTEETGSPGWLEGLRDVEAYKVFGNLREEWLKCVAHNAKAGKQVNRARFEGWLKLGIKHRDGAVNGEGAGKVRKSEAAVASKGKKKLERSDPIVELDDKLRDLIRDATEIATSDLGFTRLFMWDYFGEESKLEIKQKIESLMPAVLQAETEGLWSRGDCDGLEICGNKAFWDRWLSGEIYSLEGKGNYLRISTSNNDVESRRQQRQQSS
jgi:hypothetical protein